MSGTTESHKIFEEHFEGWGFSSWEIREILFDYIDFVRINEFKPLKAWLEEHHSTTTDV